MRLRIVNMTTFFNRELLMYSLGDIKFKKPIALKKVAYVTLFLVIWAVPMVLLFGIPTGPFGAIFTFVIPIVAGNFAAKPVFGGKGLLDFTKTAIHFQFSEPAGWLDFNPSEKLDKEVFFAENEIWISRRRELFALSRGGK